MTYFNFSIADAFFNKELKIGLLKRSASAPDLTAKNTERKVARCHSSCKISFSDDTSSDFGCRLASPISIGDEDVFRPIDPVESTLISSPNFKTLTLHSCPLPLPEYLTSEDEGKKQHDYKIIGRKESVKEMESLKGKALDFFSRKKIHEAKKGGSASSFEAPAISYQSLLSTNVMKQFALDINRTTLLSEGQVNLEKSVKINGIAYGMQRESNISAEELSFTIMQKIKSLLIERSQGMSGMQALDVDAFLILDKMHQGIQAEMFKKIQSVLQDAENATLFAGFYDSTEFSLEIAPGTCNLTINYKIELMSFDAIDRRQREKVPSGKREEYSVFRQRLTQDQQALALIESVLTLDPLKPEHAFLKIDVHPQNVEGNELINALMPHTVSPTKKAIASISSWVSEKLSPRKKASIT